MTALGVYKDDMMVEFFEKMDRDGCKLFYERWLSGLTGIYTCHSDDDESMDVTIGEKTITVAGVSARYEVPLLNGYPFDVLDVKSGPWEGCWHFVETAEGFNVYRSVLSEYGFFEELESHPSYVLTWSDPDKGRWDFASKARIKPDGYTKPTLRIIRNAILAKHGYVFQSPDLKTLFEQQLWYEPAKDNSEVKLSFIEQMNIALIQGEEAQDDGNRWLTEEEPGVKREYEYE
ncbi:MAG: YARHG domain-containing protein [Bacteroidales bacterium]|jgi:hypothetical protein|nr:YARHG domain-containing protein [Bacteroidales bacterium]